MLKAIKGSSKKIIVIMAVMIFTISMIFFISPGKIYAPALFEVHGESNATTVINGETLQMYATLGGSPASGVIIWDCDDGTGTATITKFGGLLTATGVGTVTVTAWRTDIGNSIPIVITITEAPASVLAAPRPLTPDEWVDLNLNMGQLVDHYGATSLGFLGMLYDNSMQRIPDAPGLNYWNEQLTGGVFGANFVVEHFIFSDEIGAKVAAMSNSEFINFLYSTLFARVPDTDGYNNWLSYMNNGFSKEETLRAFLNNEEWINICKLFNVTP
jgi:hypothetical protein